MRLLRIIVLLTVLLGGAHFAVAAPPTSHDGKRPNPDLLHLPANTWVKVKPNRDPEGRSFSGICWGNGLIYYFGGGHGSYVGNDVELYDVAANTWTQATECEDWRDYTKWTHASREQLATVANIGGGSNPQGVLSPRGGPLTHHTYQMHCWFPEERAFYNMCRGVGLFAFDPAERRWREITRQLPELKDVSSGALAYDPALRTLVAFTAGGDSGGTYVYDRARKIWARQAIKVPGRDWSGVYTTYDCTRKVHVVYVQRKMAWFAVDVTAGTAKPMKDLANVIKAAGNYPDDGKVHYVQDVSIAYDPESKATLAITKRDRGLPVDLWAYDAGKDEWSEVKMAGVPPTGIVHWCLLVHDPEHKCCLFLNLQSVQGSARQGGRVDGLYAFRLKK